MRKIKTKDYVPIKYPMMKVCNTSDEKHIDMYKHCLEDVLKDYQEILDSNKKGSKYVCRKERLEKIDFDIPV